MSKTSKNKLSRIVLDGLGVAGVTMTTPAIRPQAKKPAAKGK